MVSTMQPAQVARVMVQSAVAKHKDRYENIFFKAVRFLFIIFTRGLIFEWREQVLAGVMLSFGGLLSEIVSGGSPGLTQSNPGLVKILGGLVFPVGLAMYVSRTREI